MNVYVTFFLQGKQLNDIHLHSVIIFISSFVEEGEPYKCFVMVTKLLQILVWSYSF